MGCVNAGVEIWRVLAVLQSDKVPGPWRDMLGLQAQAHPLSMAIRDITVQFWGCLVKVPQK